MRIAWKVRVAGWSPGRPRPRTPATTRASSPVVARGRVRTMARASARARGSSPSSARGRRRGEPRRGRRDPRSRRRDGHPAGGAATPPPPPPAPAHERRPPARCPSASSLAAPRVPKRSPPSPLTSTSARTRRRLMLTESLALQPEIVQQIRVVLEDLLLVVAVDQMIDVLGPDAEPVGRADEHHLAPDAGVLAQRGRDQHAPLGVELHVLCGADVVRLEGRQLAVEALLGGDLLLEALPSRERIHVQARTSAASELGNHEALVLEPGEHLPEAGRDGDPPLVVHQVLMGAAEHSMPYRASLPYHPKAPIQHSTPRPTTIPHRPCACSQIEGRLSSEVSNRQPISPGLRPRLRPGHWTSRRVSSKSGCVFRRRRSSSRSPPRAAGGKSGLHRAWWPLTTAPSDRGKVPQKGDSPVPSGAEQR